MAQPPTSVSSTGTIRTLLARLWQALVARPAIILVAGGLLCLADAAILLRSLSNGQYAIINGDFGAFLKAAHLLAAGKNPYDVQYWLPAAFWYGTSSVHDQYPYPPFFAEITQVLSLPGDLPAYLLWAVLSITAAVCALILVLRHFGVRTPWPWVLLILGIFFASAVARNETYHGQANYLLLFLFVCGLWLMGRLRKGWGGALWGLAIAVKPFLGVLLIWLLWKRQWRAALSCMLTGGLVTIIAFAITVPGQGLAIVQGWLNTTSYYGSVVYSARPDNYSMRGFFVRIFAANPFTYPWVESGALLTVASALLLIALVAAFVLAVPMKQPAVGAPDADPMALSPALLVETGLVLALGFTYGPLTEGDHIYLLVPGLIGVILFAYKRWRFHSPTAVWWLATAALWALALFRLFLPIDVIVGQAGGATWTQTGGPGLLWSGQIGLPLLAGTLTLAYVLWREHKLRAENAAAVEAGAGDALPAAARW